MKKAWLFLGDHFDALKPRERLSIFLALAAVLVGLFFFLSFNPARARYQQEQASVQQSEQGLVAARAAELALFEGANLDPDVEARQQIKRLGTENQGLRQLQLSAQAQLASPDQMSGMLRELIAAQKELELVSVRTLPAEDLLARSAEPAGSAPRAAGGQSLYRHAIELSVRGNYRALSEYLQRVEALPWKVHLAQMRLQTGQYPQATMTLTLNTFSLERAWLSF